MTFVALLIAAAAIAVLALLSWRADRRLRAFERLPMQWGLNGQPNWYAPRRIALAFTPVLAGLMLAGTASIPLVASGPMTGDGETVFSSVMLFSALVWVAIHTGYLWMLDRWAKAQI